VRKLFSRVFEDVKRGDNLEVIVVIIAAVVALVLSLLGKGTVTVLLSINCLAIGAVAIAILQQRSQISELSAKFEESSASERSLLEKFAGVASQIERKVESSSVSVAEQLKSVKQLVSTARFEHDQPYELGIVLQSSNVVFIAGVDLSRTYQNYRKQLENFLGAGKELRVMIYQPGSPAIDFAVKRSLEVWSLQRQEQLCLNGIEDFRKLKAIPGAKVDLRLSPIPFPYGVVAGDYREANGFICLKHYTFRCDNYDKPYLRITFADGFWFRQYADELDSYFLNSVVDEIA
jgi:hypothetical protein